MTATKKDQKLPLEVTVHIAGSLHRRFKAVSKQTGQRLNFMVEEALEAWLARQATNAVIHRLHTGKRTPKMRAGSAR